MVKDKDPTPAEVLGWGLVIAACIFAISFFDSRTHARVFVGCTALAVIAYLRTVRLLSRLTERSNLLVWCLVLAAAWRVALLLSPPTLSTDVYRYVWDGRIQRLGYDPYLVVPDDSSVRHLHTAETLLMNHPDFPTPYPAAAELFFRAVTAVDESARAMKSAALLSDAALAAILFWWLVASNRSPWWVLAYAWNPMIALEGAGNGHIDLLGTLFLVLAAASLARGRRAVSAVAFALAVGIKFLPVILAPLFWGRIRFRDAALGAGILAALYIPFLGHGQLPLGSLGGYLTRWRFNAPVFSVLELAFPIKGLVGIPVVIGFGVALWARWHLDPDSPEAWAWPVAATLLFAPTIFPWYLVWFAPFLFAPRAFPLAVWTVSSLAIYWPLTPWAAMAVEYGSVLAATGWMLTRRWERRVR